MLDVKDRKILYELDKDARQPISQIAKKVGLSKQLTKYRIDKLIENKSIQQFVMMLDTKKMGYCFYDLFLQLQNMPKSKQEEFVTFLKGIDTVGWLASTIGKWDIVVAIFTKDISEFNATLDEIYTRYGKYIKDKTFIIDISAFSCKNKFLSQEENELDDEYYGSDKIVKLDKNDMRLLKLLDEDVRRSALDISKKIGVSFDTVQRKIKKLKKKGVIQGFKIKVDPSVFGHEWHLVLFELNAINDLERQKFVQKLRKHKHVVFIINTIGNWNMMVDVHVRGSNHFQEFIEELKEEFGYMIKSYENLTVAKDHKTTYVPEAVMRVC
jgi:Lrp/AsnC family transcriptional regulator, regulator for asnA, asnC and gidA